MFGLNLPGDKDLVARLRSTPSVVRITERFDLPPALAMMTDPERRIMGSYFEGYMRELSSQHARPCENYPHK